ncbi:undecaprenyl/decaprenyl-phosphate alpha-N-acetylglucosaminyl 1-phosphate transferase [Halomonas sp. MCCC 1A17488]|uniref:MraY family glycosyltransferase n=1 Tax=unclassified Halomonas TaxID=2609666 RepID=UPI0018D22DF6|nr:MULTISPECIES: MraY family glycosyltransferase [unclassified Halomonas]MCE8014840.1 undecaprenyl/decaprenyl-phosphate alpha-N-acetylglucosaminyl 1-phosphate transferase [Halomonas sp. MCCC 1A17488]MCG3238173.1 undecaprenyl/decaprenyl-phosphate alpha-N-acetylglucosaminyl 1-phosphate transferase [Halomonas sp. MCCC 1A17488]QPP48060.1 undecaprenyl/decaprenyl-phosphate alpha-N-acetylglucosaminyl 1-phosphate transferase [Halomonas sp. SS10-MC5]
MDPWSFIPLLAMGLSALAIAVLRRPAAAVGLADRPGGRKQHQGVVPLTGGLGVFIGFLLVQPFLPGVQSVYVPLFAGMALLVACGVIDDARDMRSTVKLGVQLLAAVLMVVWGGQVVTTLGEFPVVGAVQLGWLAVPVTVFAVAGLINAVNMMDGIDGLAGGTVLVMLSWLGIIAAVQGQLSLLVVIASLAAAVVGFLFFNMRHPWRKRASVFMGDAGSMALGFAIAWFVIELSQYEQAVLGPVAYGWILVMPVMDTLSLMIRRIRKGRSPFAADREHLHHIFLRAGFLPGSATLALMSMTAVLGAVGVVGSLLGVPDLLMLLGLIGVAVAHYVFIRHAWRTSKALRRLYATPQGPAILVRAQADGVMLRTRPLVGGWRRRLALAGLYLALFTLTLNPWFSALGAGLVLLATLFALPAFLRDATRLPLFWASLALGGYVLVRTLEAGGAVPVSPDWLPLVLITGVVSIPIGWWLAQLRLQWPWLFTLFLLGGIASFVLHADWPRLGSGVLSNPHAWGNPSQTGFLASNGFLILLAMLFSGVQRLGIGWRPTYQVGAALLMCVPVLVVLVASGYATGWIGAMVGVFCFAGITLMMGIYRSRQFGLVGTLTLLLTLLVGLVTWQGLVSGNRTLVEGLYHPLQAIVLTLQGEVATAHVIHPGSTERLMLWAQAWNEWQGSLLFGTGSMAPGDVGLWLKGYQGFHSLYAGIAAGFGLVGVLGFVGVTLMLIRAVVLVAVHKIWPAAWAIALLNCAAAVVTMFFLAVPLRDPGSLALVVLLVACGATAAFHQCWISMRRTQADKQAWFAATAHGKVKPLDESDQREFEPYVPLESAERR